MSRLKLNTLSYTYKKIGVDGVLLISFALRVFFASNIINFCFLK